VGGRVGIDAYNALYGFLANIRQPDGTPLKDSKGRVTSHLSGLLYRTANLYEAGIKPCYVFDGEPPALKKETLEERDDRRSEAEEAYEEAARRGDEAAMLKHAQQATRLEPPQVETSAALLDALNVPWIEAPAEGEAQAARMCRDDDLDSVGSQDYDALLFGAPTLVRNLTVRGRGGDELTPERIVLEETLDELGLTRRNSSRSPYSSAPTTTTEYTASVLRRLSKRCATTASTRLSRNTPTSSPSTLTR